MPVFRYSANDSRGNTREGSIEAIDQLQAMDLLRRDGLSPLAVIPLGETVQQSVTRSVWGPLFGGVSLNNLAIFFRQLTTLVNAGLGLTEALSSISHQTQSNRLRTITQEMVRDTMAGRPISETMLRHPNVFNNLQINLVRAGEEGGLLYLTLGQIANYLEKELELRRLYRMATLYPKIVLVLAIALPGIARLVINAFGSDIQIGGILNNIQFYYVLIPVLIVLWAVFRWSLQMPGVRYAWDAFNLSIPILGFTLKQLAMVKFGRALGALYAAGYPIARAVAVAAEACGNTYLEQTIKPAVFKIERGESITTALFETRCFPRMVLDMINTGERTGDLDKMLGSVSDYYEAEATTKTHQMGIFFGVLVLLLVGVLVGYIVINFWTGYFGTLFNTGNE